MTTTFIVNGFGRYETRDYESTPTMPAWSERGITLKYAGIEFWLPYDKPTPIPDWTFREVDHAKSTPDSESEGQLQYLTFVVRGERIAEELCDTQVPVANRDKGIITLSRKEAELRRVPNKTSIIPSGWDE